MSRDSTVRDRMKRTRERLRYEFDNYMSRGGRSPFVILIVVFVLFVVAMFLVRFAVSLLLPSGTDGVDAGPVESAITAFFQTFDPGYMATDLSSSQWVLGAAMIAGVGGIVLVALLVAFMTTGLDGRLAKLRRGHSPVVEDEHTLILGWEEQRVVEIIRELGTANEKPEKASESRRRKVVVVLADQDKQYMDDHLGRELGGMKSTRFVTRSGDPASTTDLKVVSVATAKSAIILSECSYAASDEKKEEADARVIMSLLALESLVSDSKQPAVVVDLFHGKSRKASSFVGIGSVQALDAKTVLARILLQTSRSVGLSVVYDEVFSFRGAEFYVKKVKHIEGKPSEGLSFGDASSRLAHGVAVGVVNKDENGGVSINPDSDRILKDTDQLIILAEDDSEISFDSGPTEADGSETDSVDQGDPEPDSADQEDPRIDQLLIGWGPKTIRLLDEYAKYAVPQAGVHIMRRSRGNDEPPDCEVERYGGRLNVKVLKSDPTEPRTWDPNSTWSPKCDPDMETEPVNPLQYRHIIILSDGDRGVPADVVDARTITILLLLRNAIRTLGKGDDGRRPTIVTELVESDIKVVVPDVDSHDFVISSRILSMFFAQFSENPEMHEIYMSLFGADGSEIYMKPIDRYRPFLAGDRQEFSFHDLMMAANRFDEICIGVKIKRDEDNADRNYGVCLIPDDRKGPIRLGDGDSLIVLSENDTGVPSEG